MEPADDRPQRDLAEVVDTARALVSARFPGATAAVLAGSTVSGTATPTSDLDIVVVMEGRPAPYRETISCDGRPVELFVHTEASLVQWYAHDRADARCTLAHMMATGVALTGARTATLQSAARSHLEAGPLRWTTDELAQRRYALTDAVDNLADVGDPDEGAVVSGQVLVMVAEMVLDSRGAWSGRGRWLVRQLRASDPELAARLLSAYRAAVATADPVELIAVADSVLAEVGGRLSVGYRAVAD